MTFVTLPEEGTVESNLIVRRRYKLTHPDYLNARNKTTYLLLTEEEFVQYRKLGYIVELAEAPERW
jgi:hypothetical protein